uniref:Uncharacterized protein n=1 Tax=Anguilla anguilla TaxID=7936 RepID=A0A0E9RZ21_ANGAN
MQTAAKFPYTVHKKEDEHGYKLMKGKCNILFGLQNISSYISD